MATKQEESNKEISKDIINKWLDIEELLTSDLNDTIVPIHKKTLILNLLYIAFSEYTPYSHKETIINKVYDDLFKKEVIV